MPQLFAATLLVDASGTATLAGKVFDGTPIVAKGSVDVSNIARVGSTLYAGKGRALAAVGLSTTPQTLTSANFSLLRPGRANQSVELPALDVFNVGAICARYVPPPANQRVLTVWAAGTGNADLSGGGFAALTTKALTISTANKVLVTVPLPEKLTITLVPATGVYTGSVISTGATTPKAIYGVLVQGGGSSFSNGFFLNGIVPGKVQLRGP